MNILILNASPKSKGSASAFYSSLLRLFLTGCEVKVNPLRGARDYEKTFALLPWADAVVISAPVYVDAAPSHVTAFLEQAEQICQEKPCHFKLYAISNCGFIEGHQNELHLRIYEAWCQRAGVCWGGGLGIGGGVILRWMCMLTALFAVLDTVQLILMAQAAPLTVRTIFSCYGSMLVTLALCVLPTAMIQLKTRIRGDAVRRAILGIFVAFTVFMVVGRLLSGVHWLSDIVGGVLLSAGLFHCMSLQ